MTRKPPESDGPSLMLAPWNGMSLPGLLQGGATLRAGAPALSEPQDIESLMGRAPIRLTCRQFSLAVDLAAQKLRSLGIRPGEVVLTFLPNTAEAAIALIAIQKLGALPAPLPIFESIERLAAAAALTEAAGIVTVTGFAGIRAAERAREAAAAALNVRLVAAFGADVPEGVSGLDDWEQVEFIGKAGFPRLDGRMPALVTFDEIGGAMRALVRSHEQLVAEAATAASLARVTAGSRLLMPLPPATAAGVVLGLALPLLSGAHLELNALFDSCTFGAQLGDGADTTVVLPAAAAHSYAGQCAERAMRAESVILVHRPRPHEPLLATPEFERDARLVDMLCLGEALTTMSPRAVQAQPGRVPKRATAQVPGILQADRPTFTCTLDPEGLVTVQGALVPHRLGEAAAPLATGFPANKDDRRLLLINPPPGSAQSAA